MPGLGWGQNDDMTPQQRREARKNAERQMREQRENEKGLKRLRAQHRETRTGSDEGTRHAR